MKRVKGKPVANNSGRQVVVVALHPEIVKRINAAARALDQPRSAVLRMWILKALQHHEAPV